MSLQTKEGNFISRLTILIKFEINRGKQPYVWRYIKKETAASIRRVLASPGEPSPISIMQADGAFIEEAHA